MHICMYGCVGVCVKLRLENLVRMQNFYADYIVEKLHNLLLFEHLGKSYLLLLSLCEYVYLSVYVCERRSQFFK